MPHAMCRYFRYEKKILTMHKASLLLFCLHALNTSYKRITAKVLYPFGIHSFGSVTLEIVPMSYNTLDETGEIHVTTICRLNNYFQSFRSYLHSMWSQQCYKKFTTDLPFVMYTYTPTMLLTIKINALENIIVLILDLN